MTWTVTNFIIQVIAGIVGGHAAVIETLAPAGPVLAGVFVCSAPLSEFLNYLIYVLFRITLRVRVTR
jgi:hypothetical protein